MKWDKWLNRWFPLIGTIGFAAAIIIGIIMTGSRF